MLLQFTSIISLHLLFILANRSFIVISGSSKTRIDFGDLFQARANPKVSDPDLDWNFAQIDIYELIN